MRRIFNSYRLDPLESGGVKPAETHNSYESKLNDYTKTINDITSALIDGETGNDDKAKEAGENMIRDLNASFNEEVKNHFIKNPDKLIAFEKVISEAIRKLKENNRDEYKPLEDFLNKIKSIFPTINTVDVNHTVVDLSLNEDVKLDGIQEGEEDKREKKFFKGIDETDGQSLSKLGETIKDIKEQNDIIAAITAIGASKIPGEIMEKVKGLKDLFVNINNVINNTSPNNVQILQNYIFNNLDENDQKKFKDSNKYNKITEQFDGKFGESTLDGLNKVLEKTRTYLEDVNKKFGSVEDPKYAEVKANENVNIQLNGVIDPKNLVNNLPDGATVALADGQTLQTDKPGNFKVKVNVLVGGNVVKSFDVNVKVGNNTETVPVQPTLNTDPCETHDGKKHLVIKNTPNFVQSTKLYGATFYSLANFEGNHEEGQPWSTVESVPDANGDYECLMKMKNAPEVYKVKIDRNGNLCPIIENYSSKKRVLLKNNPSCVVYLQNKIPAGLPGNPKIDWHSGEEDYVIKTTINGKQKIMTIEPMEIDGHGVSPDLSEHLIMMNFVHFLRLNNTIDDVDFNNKDDPDLRLNNRELEVRVDRKSNRTYDKDGKVVKNGRWYKVPLERFGLDRISEDSRKEKFKNLIKFNNGEHWEDDWDDKDKNKYYGKIALEGEAEVIDPTSPQLIPSNNGDIVSPINTTPTNIVDGTRVTDVTAPGTPTLNGNSTLNGDPTLNNGDRITPTPDESDDGISIDEVVVVGYRPKPKEPIDFGTESEVVDGNKTGKLEGIGAFDGNGNFVFEGGIQELTQGDKKTINLGDDTFTMVNYVRGKGMSIQEFTGKGYQVGDTGEMKWFFIGEYDVENKVGKGKRIFENGTIYDGEWRGGFENGKGKYLYTNGDVYDGNFKDGMLDGDGIYTWKNGCKFEGKFESDEMTTGVFVLKTQGGEYRFNVEKDEKGLKIVSAVDTNLNSEVVGKYIDVKNSNILNFDGDLGTSQDTRIFAVGKFGNGMPEAPMTGLN